MKLSLLKITPLYGITIIVDEAKRDSDGARAIVVNLLLSIFVVCLHTCNELRIANSQAKTVVLASRVRIPNTQVSPRRGRRMRVARRRALEGLNTAVEGTCSNNPMFKVAILYITCRGAHLLCYRRTFSPGTLFFIGKTFHTFLFSKDQSCQGFNYSKKNKSISQKIIHYLRKL